MKQRDDPIREIAALRDRLSMLSEATLRINESLEFETVLQEIVDSARTLTNARYGAIVMVDDSGKVQDLLISGMTEEQKQQLMGFSEGGALFKYLMSVREPLRTADFIAHINAVGIPEYEPSVRTFLGIQIRDGTTHVGGICIGEKENGEEFTPEDEEMLMMFASHAAMAIANARRHREEQRARANLHTLIDTSPVGVVVFDAGTGRPLSFNREARRIVDVLRNMEQSAEQLLDVVTFRRADGRETSLAELPLARALRSGETVRAEEIVIEVPDGRSVTTIVNATPIWSEDAEVESVVVTLQDMTPLEEMERMRAEFLAMVSHELRTPLTSIKGSITTLLDPSNALNPTETLQFHRIIDDQTDRMRVLIADLLDVARIETGTLSVSPEPTDIAAMAREAGNAFRIGGYRQTLDIDLPPDLPWVIADRLRMVQVLTNLLSNAARHSPESSAIRVGAVREGVHVAVSVYDEGGGIPAERLPHLFRKFSRTDAKDQGGDTGLGLAICKGIVEAHGGRIWAESDGPGQGTRFTFTIPTAEESVYVSTAPPVQVSSPLPRQQKGGEQVRVLTVDDDPQALRYIRDALSKAGFAPIATGVPDDVMRLLEQGKPHLVLMDLMLPGSDGIELMQDIIREGDVPVIFVSAYGQDQLIARAFEMGAADYVVKPFSPTELVARIRAALRNRESPEPSEPYVKGDLIIDYSERRVTLAGSPVRLTAMEYRMLAQLSANAGKVLTYGQLLKRVWGAESDADVRPMRTVVSTLRRRLDDDADNPKFIFTDPRVGYRMPKGATPETETSEVS